MRFDPAFRFGLEGRGRNRRGEPVRSTPALRVIQGLFVVGIFGLSWGGLSAWRAWPQEPSPETPGVSAPPPVAGVPLAWIDDPPRSRERFALARSQAEEIDPSSAARLVEWFDPIGINSFHRRGAPLPSGLGTATGERSVRVEYSLNQKLTEDVFEIFRRGRVQLGLAIVLDPLNGRVLAYVVSDPEVLRPERVYPAASIVKILTAATLMEESPREAAAPCIYQGNPYRLSSRRLARPHSGSQATLEKALATSNNQCFSQWAIHVLGGEKLRATIKRFGWLDPPAPGHDAGRIDPVTTDFELGRLASGLDGLRVNPLHIASLASVLTHGRWIEPSWVDRVVDSDDRSLVLPARAPVRRVVAEDIADRLRSMMVSTTTKGTAKRAFRTRLGRPLLPGIDVAGKTGNLIGRDPYGRYEWFLGLAPADAPTIAVVVLQVQGSLWWSRSSELGARILQDVFCDAKSCRAEQSNRWTVDPSESSVPLLMSDIERSTRSARVD